MKRSPLKRKTPLRPSKLRLAVSHAIGAFRSTHHGDAMAYAMRGAKKTTKHARRERAPESWFLWVKSQPCFVAWLLSNVIAWPKFALRVTPCCAVIDADHMGNRFSQGDGTRGFDWTCVSICHDHHMERHGLTGAFKDFDGDMMKLFTESGIWWMWQRAIAAGVRLPSC